MIDKVPEIIELAYQRERERIIALLEAQKCNVMPDEGCLCGSYDEAIALIKGETE